MASLYGSNPLSKINVGIAGSAGLMRAQRIAPLSSKRGSNAQNGRDRMPQGKHLRGVSKKEQREYEHIKKSAQRSGRYKGRAKEVAARTVMKHHKKRGHSKGH